MKEKDTNALYYKLQVLNNPHLLKASFLYLIIFLLFYLLPFLLVGYHLYSSDRSKQLLSLSLSWQNYYLSKVIEVFFMQLIRTLMQNCGQIGFFFFFWHIPCAPPMYACPLSSSKPVLVVPYSHSTLLRITIVSCNKLSTLHEHFIKLIKGDKKVIVQTQDTPNTLHSTSNTRHITWLIKL